MAPISKRLARKGKGESIHFLLQQGSYTREQIAKFLDDLLADGLPTTFLAEFDATLAIVSAGSGKQKESRDIATGLNRDELIARRGAKSFKRRLWNAVRLILKTEDESKLQLANFVAGPIDTSTPRLATYLDRIRPHVVTLDERLKPYFKNGSAVAQLDATKTALVTADAAQETTFANAPLDTLALYEAKGKLLEMIEHANGVARIAFDGNADVRARFNKDILLRASRTAGKGSAEAEVTPTDEPTEKDPVPG